MIAHGFQYDPFAEACRLYWDLMIQDSIDFSADNIKVVGPEELNLARDEQELLDYLRMYRLLPDKIKKNLALKGMIQAEQRGIAGFLAAFDGQGELTGVYSHHNDVCYILETVPASWADHSHAFHATVAVHELGHRYVRKKRETLNINGIGNAFWEEKYCGFIEAGFHAYVFASGSEVDHLKRIDWRRNEQRTLGTTRFNIEIDTVATGQFIAKYISLENQ